MVPKNPAMATERGDESRLVGPNGYLTFAEGNLVVDWIIEEQRRKACPTSLEVRKKAVIFDRSASMNPDPAQSIGGVVLRTDIWNSIPSRSPLSKTEDTRHMPAA
jgi:hypothetical protein